MRAKYAIGDENVVKIDVMERWDGQVQSGWISCIQQEDHTQSSAKYPVGQVLTLLKRIITQIFYMARYLGAQLKYFQRFRGPLNQWIRQAIREGCKVRCLK